MSTRKRHKRKTETDPCNHLLTQVDFPHPPSASYLISFRRKPGKVMGVDLFGRRLSQRIDQHVDRWMGERGTNEGEIGVSRGTTILRQDVLEVNFTLDARHLHPCRVGSSLGLVWLRAPCMEDHGDPRFTMHYTPSCYMGNVCESLLVRRCVRSKVHGASSLLCRSIPIHSTSCLPGGSLSMNLASAYARILVGADSSVSCLYNRRHSNLSRGRIPTG